MSTHISGVEFTRRAFLKLTVALALSLGFASCGDPAARAAQEAERAEMQRKEALEMIKALQQAKEREIRRPSDEGFIGWLQGQRVVAEKHVLLDDHWKIEPKEVSNFVVREITRNPMDKTFAATLFFRATASGRGIECEAILIYEPGDADQLKFVSFTPSKVTKLGNW